MKPILLTLIVFATLSFCSISHAYEVVGYFIIEEGDNYDKVEAYDFPPWLPGPETIIDMTGGSVGQYNDPDSGLYTYDSSTFNMSGGSVDYLHTYGSSTANISGGVVSNYDCTAIKSISAHNFSIFNVYDGALLFGGSFHQFDLYDSSTVNVYGGDVSLFLLAHDSSTVNIFSGRCSFGILPYDYSTINIYGGYVDSYLGQFFVPGAATTTVNIHGYDFSYDPEALWLYWEDPCDGWWVSKLKGYGASGTAITIWGLKDPSTHSNVNLIPDFVMDRGVNFADFAAFASAWRSQKGSAGWNHIYDISDPNDDVIDEQDLAVLTEYWLAGVK